MNTTPASVRTVRNHRTAVAFLEARRAELLDSAADSAAYATLYNVLGITELVELHENIARTALAEVAKIDAARVR